jgi:hypothetical protein
MNQKPEQTIEIDCPPGPRRPGDFIDWVIAGTGLEWKAPKSMFFGNWKWDYNDVPEEEYNKIRPLLRLRIISLHHRRLIRYGSW